MPQAQNKMAYLEMYLSAYKLGLEEVTKVW